MRLLFLCTANSERSPTAENMFRNSRKFEAKSAGVHPAAFRVVDQNLVDWADMIFVMSEREDGHLTLLKQHADISHKQVFDLNIPDMFPRGDPELENILYERLSCYLNLDV